MITPDFLNKGDAVAMVAPAGKADPQMAESACSVLESWGLKVIRGKHLLNTHYNYAARDSERAADFQNALDNPDVKAIICARGGYGTIRILESLDFTRFSKSPKWIVGFSDITVLHSHIHQQYGIETMHGSMASGFVNSEKWPATITSLHDALFGKKIKYTIESNELNRPGSCSGLLVGGNLAILCSLTGTPSDLNTDGKILFIEEIGEHLYRIDRMMWQLKRAGKLKNLAGLIVGGMTDIPDTKADFGKTAYEIVAESVEEYNYPVCFGFPAGHQDDNRSLILGRAVTLDFGTEPSMNFEPVT
jgi:muramoyltetrapeptide carboxypeptidase